MTGKTSGAPGTVEGGTVALVVSPKVAAEDEIKPLRALLQQAGLHIGEELGVADLEGDTGAGKRWRRGQFRAVVAAGGDGTIGTTASRLLGTGIPLGILPMGTSNDVARALGIPFDLAAAAAAIAGGVPTQIDTGVVRLLSGNGGRESGQGWRRLLTLARWRGPDSTGVGDAASALCFLHAATLGLNVEFARLATDASRRAALGGLTYPAASLEALTHLQSIPVTLTLSGVPARATIDGHRREKTEGQWQVSLATEVFQLAVVNTPLFGGGLNLWLPGVDAHDHLLDVFLIEPPNLEKGLETVRALMRRLWTPRRWWKALVENRGGRAGQSQEVVDLAGEVVFPGIRRYQARQVSIQTASPVQVTLDGELRALTPVQIWVEPAHVTVFLPVPAGSGRAEYAVN